VRGGGRYVLNTKRAAGRNLAQLDCFFTHVCTRTCDTCGVQTEKWRRCVGQRVFFFWAAGHIK